MCRRIECATCKKPSFAGCGRHIEAVLGDVPVADRCQCSENQSSKKGGWFGLFSSAKRSS